MIPLSATVKAAPIFIRRSKHSAKNWALSVLGILLLLWIPCAAYAADLHAVPESRMVVRMPDGLVAQAQKSAGRLNLTVNSKNTDWGRVLLQSSDPSYAEAIVGIVPPEDAVYYMLECGSVDDDDMILSWLDEDLTDYSQEKLEGMRADNLIENGQFIAQSVNDYRIVYPYPEHTYLYVRWYKADGSELQTEKLEFSCVHTMSEGIYAPLYQIKKDDIIPYQNDQEIVSCEVSDGNVTYTVASNASLSIVTEVRVPDGTKSRNLLSLSEGNRELQIEDGKVRLSTGYSQRGSRKKSFGLEFLDSNKNMIDCGLISIEHLPKEKKPWTSYVEDDTWLPVRDECLKLTIKGGSGVRMPYTGGILSYDFSKTSDDLNALAEDKVTMLIVPPDGAKYVRQNSMGGHEGLLGKPTDNGDEAKEYLSYQEAEPVSGMVTVSHGDAPVLLQMNTYDGVSLFVPTVPTGADAGLVYLFAWYENEEKRDRNEPSEIWWFVEKAGPFVKIIENPAVQSETDIPGRFSGAIVIGEKEWKMVTQIYLQEGENAQHMEICLKDSDGNTFSPEKNTVVYLPYPEGLTYESPVMYTLRHYDAEGGQEPVTSLTPTPVGLRFETKSFSPFVLQWQEMPDTGSLPMTGDTSSLIWPAAQLLLAAAALTALLRKRFV